MKVVVISHLNLVISLNFFSRTANITGEIVLKDAEVAMPGETIFFEVNLVEKAAINDGLRFVMREGTKTLGAGIILKVID